MALPFAIPAAKTVITAGHAIYGAATRLIFQRAAQTALGSSVAYQAIDKYVPPYETEQHTSGPPPEPPNNNWDKAALGAGAVGANLMFLDPDLYNEPGYGDTDWDTKMLKAIQAQPDLTWKEVYDEISNALIKSNKKLDENLKQNIKRNIPTINQVARDTASDGVAAIAGTDDPDVAQKILQDDPESLDLISPQLQQPEPDIEISDPDNPPVEQRPYTDFPNEWTVAPSGNPDGSLNDNQFQSWNDTNRYLGVMEFNLFQGYTLQPGVNAEDVEPLNLMDSGAFDGTYFLNENSVTSDHPRSRSQLYYQTPQGGLNIPLDGTDRTYLYTSEEETPQYNRYQYLTSGAQPHLTQWLDQGYAPDYRIEVPLEEYPEFPVAPQNIPEIPEPIPNTLHDRDIAPDVRRKVPAFDPINPPMTWDLPDNQTIENALDQYLKGMTFPLGETEIQYKPHTQTRYAWGSIPTNGTIRVSTGDPGGRQKKRKNERKTTGSAGRLYMKALRIINKTWGNIDEWLQFNDILGHANRNAEDTFEWWKYVIIGAAYETAIDALYGVRQEIFKKTLYRMSMWRSNPFGVDSVGRIMENLGANDTIMNLYGNATGDEVVDAISDKLKEWRNKLIPNKQNGANIIPNQAKYDFLKNIQGDWQMLPGFLRKQDVPFNAFKTRSNSELMRSLKTGEVIKVYGFDGMRYIDQAWIDKYKDYDPFSRRVYEDQMREDMATLDLSSTRSIRKWKRYIEQIRLAQRAWRANYNMMKDLLPKNTVHFPITEDMNWREATEDEVNALKFIDDRPNFNFGTNLNVPVRIYISL